MLASIPAAPPTLAATESWPPNPAITRRNLARFGAAVAEAADAAALPFDAYGDRLAEIHAFIERHGPFVAHSQRVLIEARRPR